MLFSLNHGHVVSSFLHKVILKLRDLNFHFINLGHGQSAANFSLVNIPLGLLGFGVKFIQNLSVGLLHAAEISLNSLGFLTGNVKKPDCVSLSGEQSKNYETILH